MAAGHSRSVTILDDAVCKDAVMVAVWFLGGLVVVMVKVALVLPSATVTVAGTVA